jgi:hypothetical protein
MKTVKWYSSIDWVWLVIVFGIIIIGVSVACSGCAWQGQKDQTFVNNQMTHNAEFWSMRFVWMSSGVEVWDNSPYWQVGGVLAESKTDPNTAKAIVEGAVKGAALFVKP